MSAHLKTAYDAGAEQAQRTFARLEQLQAVLRAGKASKNPLINLTASLAPRMIDKVLQKDTQHALTPPSRV